VYFCSFHPTLLFGIYFPRFIFCYLHMWHITFVSGSMTTFLVSMPPSISSMHIQLHIFTYLLTTATIAAYESIYTLTIDTKCNISYLFCPFFRKIFSTYQYVYRPTEQLPPVPGAKRFHNSRAKSAWTFGSRPTTDRRKHRRPFHQTPIYLASIRSYSDKRYHQQDICPD